MKITINEKIIETERHVQSDKLVCKTCSCEFSNPEDGRNPQDETPEECFACGTS